MSDHDETHEEAEGDVIDDPESVEDALVAVADSTRKLILSAHVGPVESVAVTVRSYGTLFMATLRQSCGCVARIEFDGRSAPRIHRVGAVDGCVRHAVPPLVRREETATVPF